MILGIEQGRSTVIAVGKLVTVKASRAYHRTNVVGPGVVPVRGDSGASLDCSGELKSTRSAVIVAGELRVRRIGDRVAVKFENIGYSGNVCTSKGGVLSGPRALDGGLANGRVVRSPARSMSE